MSTEKKSHISEERQAIVAYLRRVAALCAEQAEVEAAVELGVCAADIEALHPDTCPTRVPRAIDESTPATIRGVIHALAKFGAFNGLMPKTRVVGLVMTLMGGKCNPQDVIEVLKENGL